MSKFNEYLEKARMYSEASIDPEREAKMGNPNLTTLFKDLLSEDTKFSKMWEALSKFVKDNRGKGATESEEGDLQSKYRKYRKTVETYKEKNFDPKGPEAKAINNQLKIIAGIFGGYSKPYNESENNKLSEMNGKLEKLEEKLDQLRNDGAKFRKERDDAKKAGDKAKETEARKKLKETEEEYKVVDKKWIDLEVEIKKLKSHK